MPMVAGELAQPKGPRQATSVRPLCCRRSANAVCDTAPPFQVNQEASMAARSWGGGSYGDAASGKPAAQGRLFEQHREDGRDGCGLQGRRDKDSGAAAAGRAAGGDGRASGQKAR